ncbi:late expression factor 11 [Spodoptera litura nucleopolyhedrovirus]|uniref:Late expression factor 11 n=1 Tax=Spodoptera litura multicapsid nucleopolyhedrovirus TaxID=46242 RepID=LEF11_NPVST|nr:LEF-11 [Spodoptera litura nucleopolyhedrovirus]Q91BI6.1 RecName: Full=Late expression factor 11 [Spodoptera litura nucleopolyhedrovirus]AAL01720.1 late expression factor 11 [Spodoptera litura nucleopolyhedrovirus]
MEETHDDRCMSRGDLYAYMRELINDKKWNFNLKNVWAHVHDSEFDTIRGYIRDHLDDAIIIHKDLRYKRLCHHRARIENLLKLNQSLKKEYENSISRYNGAAQESATRRNVPVRDKQRRAVAAAADRIDRKATRHCKSNRERTV